MIYALDVFILGAVTYLLLNKYMDKKFVTVGFIAGLVVILSAKYIVVEKVILDKERDYGDLNYLTDTELYYLPTMRFGAALFYPIWSSYFRYVSSYRKKNDPFFPLKKFKKKSKDECDGEEYIKCEGYIGALTESVRKGQATKAELYELRKLIIDKSNVRQISCENYKDFKKSYSFARTAIDDKSILPFEESFEKRIFELALNCEKTTYSMLNSVTTLGRTNKENFYKVEKRLCSQDKYKEECLYIQKYSPFNIR